MKGWQKYLVDTDLKAIICQFVWEHEGVALTPEDIHFSSHVFEDGPLTIGCEINKGGTN